MELWLLFTTIAERLTALDLFKRETNYFIHNSMLFNLELFNSNTRTLVKILIIKVSMWRRNFYIKQKKKSMIFWNSYKESFRYFI
jgi:phosphate:Na+ symporter